MNVRFNSKELGFFKKVLIAIWKFVLAIMIAKHQQSPKKAVVPPTWVVRL